MIQNITWMKNKKNIHYELYIIFHCKVEISISNNLLKLYKLKCVKISNNIINKKKL